MNDDPDDVARAILADSEMQDTEAYLARGRAFALLPVDDLNKKYAAAFTVVRVSPWYRTAPVPASDQPWYVNARLHLAMTLQ